MGKTEEKVRDTIRKKTREKSGRKSTVKRLLEMLIYRILARSILMRLVNFLEKNLSLELLKTIRLLNGEQKTLKFLLLIVFTQNMP